MAVHRIVEGEPGIFPPGPRELLRWLRGRRGRRDQAPAAPEHRDDASIDGRPDDPGPPSPGAS